MSHPESPEARAERITAELRAATAEAAGVLKDLTRVMRGAREQVDDYLHDEVQKACNSYLQQLQDGAGQFIRDHLAHLDEAAAKAARQAQTTITNAQNIKELVDATAQKIAERTIFIDGEPHIAYGDPSCGNYTPIGPY